MVAVARVQVFDQAGKLQGEWNCAHAIAADSHGNRYVGDIIGQRAQKFRRVPAGRVVPAAPGGQSEEPAADPRAAAGAPPAGRSGS
jgi:hypothetical protein